MSASKHTGTVTTLEGVLGRVGKRVVAVNIKPASATAEDADTPHLTVVAVLAHAICATGAERRGTLTRGLAQQPAAGGAQHAVAATPANTPSSPTRKIDYQH